LEVLMEIFPEAPIYTLLYDEKRTLGRFRGRVKKTSFLDFPFARKHHRLFIPLMPFAAESINLGDEYDLIISDSAGYAKGIRYGKNTKHISYIHTPLRYAWETRQYFDNKFFTTLFGPIFNYLKRWDYHAGQKPDVLIANSKFIAEKIKNYYGREAKVIYPPVDTSRFFYRHIRTNMPIDYYLAVGRLLHYKRFDLVIDAFAKLGLPLKIVGNGPEYESIKYQASSIKNIELLPFVEDEELRNFYNGAKALIFPQVEDFGLVAAEAQACGTPVIAYAAGGALEIAEDKKTGLFFEQQSAESLIAAIKKFENLKFIRQDISKRASRFSKENFKKQFLDAIRSL